MSRLFARFVSVVLLFGILGGAAVQALANEVQPVRREFTTSEEVTAVQIQEDGSSVTIRSGEGDQIEVRYADSTAEKLYEMEVKDGILFIRKLKAPPPKVVKTALGRTVTIAGDDSSGDYAMEILLPQRQYDAIHVENPTAGSVKLNSIKVEKISTQVENGAIVLSKTHSDEIKAELGNGSIQFEHPAASRYDCTVENGEIKGDVQGKYEDYAVEATVGNGTCGLRSRQDTESVSSMKLSVKNGRIDVHFDNK